MNDIGRALVIAISPGRAPLVGVLGEGGKHLSPVYELQVRAQADPRTQQVAVMHSCVPVLFLPSLKSLDLPADTVLVHVSALSGADRKVIEQAVAACDEMIGAAKASQAGITIAREMPKVKS